MATNNYFDVIIIGGSFSGLSAGLALGRSLRSVLVIDNGKPCNEQTPNAHNFLTQDGVNPREILSIAKSQLKNYITVEFYNGLATEAKKLVDGFNITTELGDVYLAKKVIIATGLKYILPSIKGLSACWGISILHCPYCHGFEFRGQKTGILGNGDIGFGLSRFIYNWTDQITLFTEKKLAMSDEQLYRIQGNGIQIIEEEIDEFEHKEGQVQNVVLKNNSKIAVNVIYAVPKFEQHSTIAAVLGCDLTEQGLIAVDQFQKTSVDGIFASGDNSDWAKTLAVAVASGNIAGISVNSELMKDDIF